MGNRDKQKEEKKASFWQKHVLKENKTAESSIVWPMYFIMLFVFAFFVTLFVLLPKWLGIHTNLFVGVSLCLGLMVAYPVQAFLLSKLYWEKAPTKKHWKRVGIAIFFYALGMGVYFFLERFNNNLRTS